MRHQGAMKCPICPGGSLVGGSHVVDSRYAKSASTYRRRRECRRCGYRWTTYEVTREDLDRMRGTSRAFRAFVESTQALGKEGLL